MDEEQKKKLREDAVRGSGILDRIGEFRHFCNRYYKLTTSQQLRDALTKELHALEGKSAELKLGTISGEGLAPAQAPTPGEGGEEGVTLDGETITEDKKNDAAEAEGIMRELAYLIADIRVDVDLRFNDLKFCSEKLQELEEQHRRLKGKDISERNKDLSPIADEILAAINRLGPERDTEQKLPLIVHNVSDYRKLVERLKFQNKLGRISPIRRTVYSWIYPKFLRNELNRLDMLAKRLNLKRTEALQKQIIALLSKFKRHDMEEDFGDKTFLPRIKAKFGSLPAQNREGIVKLIEKGEFSTDTFVGQKVMELELLFQFQEMSGKLGATIEELDKIVRLQAA